MTTTELERTAGEGRAKQIKALTHGTHERLDKTILGHDPFASRERYGLLVTVQHGFHREIDALYDDPTLDSLLPDLPGRRRLSKVEADMADLGITPPAADHAPVFAPGAPVDLPTALGWLYAAEGSNLGAAFLLKYAAELGLSETFGASHLAAAPEGRGLQWKTFTAALDQLQLDADGEARVVAGAKAAFQCVQSLVDHHFAGAAA